jgi:adenosylmethionine-8-amino-7-oxononanoate aminotransferase
MQKTWTERDADVVWHGFTQMSCFSRNAPVVVERAEGHELIDTEGRRYLDAISSLWVTTLGHRVPELDQALRDQIDRVAHSTLLGNSNRIVIEFAEALARVVPVNKPHVLFASDGACAVEQALKIAFQYWTNRGIEGRTSYLAFGDAYHGDTVGSLSVGGGGFGTQIFDPLRFDVLRAPSFSTTGALATAAQMVREHRNALAAVIVEPLVQGAAGMLNAPADEFAQLGRACRENDVLLICDEVATGFGRTGTLFASEQCGLRPDLLCLGKGITGGYLPMSATIANRKIYDAFLGADLSTHTLYHGHSYGGNALAAAVALRHLELLQEKNVLTNVRERSAQLRTLLGTLHRFPEVREIRLIGLMGAVELDTATDALLPRRVCAAMVKRGVLSRSMGPVITLVPLLTVTADEIDRIVRVLSEALEEVIA